MIIKIVSIVNRLVRDMMNGGRRGQKKTALIRSFGKPQNYMNETARDFELPMPS